MDNFAENCHPYNHSIYIKFHKDKLRNLSARKIIATLSKQFWYIFELSFFIKTVTIPSGIKLIKIALSKPKPQS